MFPWNSRKKLIQHLKTSAIVPYLTTRTTSFLQGKKLSETQIVLLHHLISKEELVYITTFNDSTLKWGYCMVQSTLQQAICSHATLNPNDRGTFIRQTTCDFFLHVGASLLAARIQTLCMPGFYREQEDHWLLRLAHTPTNPCSYLV